MVGLPQGQRNPSLFTYRSQSIARVEATGEQSGERWRADLDPSGLGVTDPRGRSLRVKGGATIFIEKGEGSDLGRSPFSDLASETRFDLTLAGRLGNDRVLNGFYDTTDPENAAYQLTYRGNRDDRLRSLSLGEIEQETYQHDPHAGDRSRGGFRARRAGIAVGGDPETMADRRRMGRSTPYGAREGCLQRKESPGQWDGSRRGLRSHGGVPLPVGWTADDLLDATYYVDDAREATDNANTEHRTLAGRAGAYDRLAPNRQYVIGPDGATLILLSPMSEGQVLIGVRKARTRSGADGKRFQQRSLRNHSGCATDPIPRLRSGSGRACIDSTGASSGIPPGTRTCRSSASIGTGTDFSTRTASARSVECSRSRTSCPFFPTSMTGEESSPDRLSV